MSLGGRLARFAVRTGAEVVRQGAVEIVRAAVQAIGTEVGEGLGARLGVRFGWRVEEPEAPAAEPDEPAEGA